MKAELGFNLQGLAPLGVLTAIEADAAQGSSAR
jgi:hypothetical protein